MIKKGGMDYINNRFNSVTFLWLSQIKDQISIGICHGIVLDSKILDGRLVSFVDFGGIVANYCLNFHFTELYSKFNVS